MRIQTYTLGGVGTHCYFLINEDTKEALVADPADRADFISEKLESQGLKLKGILLTHGHGDHIMAVPALREKYGAPLLAHEAEAALLGDPRKNLSTSLFGKSVSLTADRLLKDGEMVELAGLSLKTLFTPGHTPGGCCYYGEGDGILLSGDTLFAGSIGRTDFPGGSMHTLVAAIKDRLMPLPDETKVYPGHAEMTTIGDERKFNPYLAGNLL